MVCYFIIDYMVCFFTYFYDIFVIVGLYYFLFFQKNIYENGLFLTISPYESELRVDIRLWNLTRLLFAL